MAFSNATDVISHDAAQVALYAPYCSGVSREEVLHMALHLLDAGRVTGQRMLKFGTPHVFELRWQAGTSPQERSSCQLSFPQLPEVLYGFSVPTHQLVLWLMDLIQKRDGGAESDLPENFWRWLLVGEIPHSPER
ncbi:MAG: type IV pilus biogenesis protein EbsA [Prochlorococcaceae cyanobacterium]